MTQKLNILEGWYVSKTGGPHSIATVRELAEIILAKGLTSDIDSAIKIVFTQLKISPDKGDGFQLRLEDFNRIFLLSLLKHSFLEVLS